MCLVIVSYLRFTTVIGVVWLFTWSETACNSAPMTNGDIKTTEIPVLANRLQVAATVMLEKRRVERKYWQSHAWYLDTVALGDALNSESYHGDLAYQRTTGDVYRWSGFQVTLYKDACERYWHSLISDEPKIYVVCRDADPDDDPHDMEPLSVTVDYDEALAFAETDDLTLTAPLPPELYRYMETFVLAHYRPVPFKKRKRKNWSQKESDPRLERGQKV